MILSSIAGRPTPRASRADYVRDWLAGLDEVAVASDSGEAVVPETALRVAVIYRAINVLAHAIASVPLVTYERFTDGGKRAATKTSTYKLLHDKPNAWMTSFRYRHLLMVRAVVYGDSYTQLLPGPGGISQMIPLEPATTRVVDQLSNGKLLYVTRDLTKTGYGPERRLIQDEVTHVRGFSMDGKRGVPLLDVARNAIGLALSAEKHGSMFLRNGARFAGILTTPGDMDDEVRSENEESWRRANGGALASGTVPMLTNGLRFESISPNNRDSQWLEARTFQVEELLRFLGVPGVLCGYADKTSTYASAEQFFLSFVKDTVRPWTENIAAELNFSVVLDPARYFAEFDLDGLLKGDITTRYTAHQKAILTGWKSRNEVRREENYDPGPPELDTFLEPVNMTDAGMQDGQAGQQPGSRPAAHRALPRPSPEPPEPSHVQFVVDAAASVVRREVAAISGGSGRLGLAVRFAKDPLAWEREVQRFYEGHAKHVAAKMHISESAALLYSNEQAQTITAGGMAIMTKDWEQERVSALAFLALEG